MSGDVFTEAEAIDGMTPELAGILLEVANEHGLAAAKALAARFGAQIVVEDEDS